MRTCKVVGFFASLKKKCQDTILDKLGLSFSSVAFLAVPVITDLLVSSKEMDKELLCGWAMKTLTNLNIFND